MGGWLSFESSPPVSQKMKPIRDIYMTVCPNNNNNKPKKIYVHNIKSYDIFEKPIKTLETIYEHEDYKHNNDIAPLMDNDINNVIYYKTDLERINIISKVEFYHSNKVSSAPIMIPVKPLSKK